MAKRAENRLLLIFQLFVCLALYCCQASRTCPRGCDCNDQQLIAKCNKSAQLDYVPHTLNPAVKELYLSRNNIRGIKSAFEVYKNLAFLDLSANNLQVVGEKNFVANSKLETILLNHNNISDIHVSTFVGLVTLKRIDLSSNIIESINGTIFQHLKALQFLDLSFNNLKLLSSDAFNGLNNLLQLNISNNYIVNFSAELLQKVPNLAYLNASYNQIEQINSDQFKFLTKLAELDLSNCLINQIDKFAFRGLTNLRFLSLHSNQLMDIPSSAFAGSSGIQTLDIGNNRIQSLPDSAFSSLRNLRLLYISNNSLLTNVHYKAFYGLDNLRLLELSNNEMLAHIGRNVFDNLYELSSLILSNNNFTTLEVDLITRYNRINLYLDVRGNPFNCNCSLEWLNFHFIRMFNKTISSNPEFFFGKNYTFATYNLDALLNQNLSDVVIKENALEVKCATPFALEDKLVIKLHKDKFGCFVIESFIPIIVGGIIGLLIVTGVVVLSIIRCKYQLSGFVKNQLYVENARNQMDLYHKPEFVFVPSVDYNTLYKQNKGEDLAVRYPLRMNCPTTEL